MSQSRMFIENDVLHFACSRSCDEECAACHTSHDLDRYIWSYHLSHELADADAAVAAYRRNSIRDGILEAYGDFVREEDFKLRWADKKVADALIAVAQAKLLADRVGRNTARVSRGNPTSAMIAARSLLGRVQSSVELARREHADAVAEVAALNDRQQYEWRKVRFLGRQLLMLRDLFA